MSVLVMFAAVDLVEKCEEVTVDDQKRADVSGPLTLKYIEMMKTRIQRGSLRGRWVHVHAPI